MGIKFRKSFKIAPCVKRNLSKRGIGVSAGVKGARVSLNSKGRITKSFGIPGTGISYASSSKIGASKEKATKTSSAMSNPVSYIAENTSADNTPTPPALDNSTPSSGGKKNPQNILRWVIYLAVILIATQINTKLCYPSMLLVGLFHLYHIKRTLLDEQKLKKSTKRTYCFLAFTVLGCLLTIPSPNIESIKLSAAEATMDINEEQLLSFTCSPTDAKASNLAVEVSAPSLAKAEQTEDGKIALHTQAKEGTFTLLAKSGSVKSNELTFHIVDKDKEKAEQKRIAAEKKAEEERIAAEKKAEEERIAAEKAEQERIAAEKAEQERIAAQKAEQERIAAQRQNQAQSQNSATVYVTPTGKRYHYSGSCNGGSYSPTTLDNALRMGLTPCKKCIG